MFMVMETSSVYYESNGTQHYEKDLKNDEY